MAFWDDMGETLSGLTDTVVNAGQSYIDGWTNWQVDSMRTASPEQNRPTVEPAQEPTGEVVNPSLYSSPQNGTQTALVMAVWGLAFVGLFIAFKD
jgi:hypothetical protein